MQLANVDVPVMYVPVIGFVRGNSHFMRSMCLDW